VFEVSHVTARSLSSGSFWKEAFGLYVHSEPQCPQALHKESVLEGQCTLGLTLYRVA
jgi:hypothetical protein